MASSEALSWFGEDDPLSAVDLSFEQPTDAQILDFSHLVSKATQRPLTQPSLSQPLAGLLAAPRTSPNPPTPFARPSTPVATASPPMATASPPMARAPSTADDPLSSPLSSPPRPASAHLGHGRDPPLSSVHGDAHYDSDDDNTFAAPTSAQPQRRRPCTGSSTPLSRVKQPDLLHPSASSLALTLDPSPFTGSQLCLNLIEPELRSAYRVAYQVAKKHVSAGTLPDWDVVWIQNCMVSYDPQVRALIRQYFDAVVQAYLSRDANSSSLAPATSASPASTPQSAQASRAPDGSSSSRSATAPTSALTSSAASIPASRQLPLNDITPSVNRGSDALLTLSTAPRKAVANGEWRGFIFQGVVRWHKHAVEEAAITYSEWLAEHGSAIEKERSRRGAGSLAERSDKAKATQGQKPSRALQYGAYRERWRCCKCRSQLHETVGRTGNLTKHRAKCT